MFIWKRTAFSWPSAIFLLPEQTTRLVCEIVGYKFQCETKNCRQHRVYARTQPQWLYKKGGNGSKSHQDPGIRTRPRSVSQSSDGSLAVSRLYEACLRVTFLIARFVHCDTQPLVINHLLRSNSACVVRNPRGSKVWLQAFHHVCATCFGGNICMRYSDGAALSTDVMKFNAI